MPKRGMVDGSAYIIGRSRKPEQAEPSSSSTRTSHPLFPQRPPWQIRRYVLLIFYSQLVDCRSYAYLLYTGANRHSESNGYVARTGRRISQPSS